MENEKEINKDEIVEMKEGERPEANDIPPFVYEALARAILKGMKEKFNNPEIMKEYEEWLKQKEEDEGERKTEEIAKKARTEMLTRKAFSRPEI